MSDLSRSGGPSTCHHEIVWTGAWPPPDETLMVCEKCRETLLWASGFLSKRDEHGEF